MQLMQYLAGYWHYIIGAAGMILSLLFLYFGTRPEKHSEEATGEEKKLYTVAETDSGILFTNNLDGYSITIPSNFRIDMSMPALLSRFENDKVTIEIYREELPSFAESLNYVGYSTNSIVYNSMLTATEPIECNVGGSMSARNITWSRAPFKIIENDRNYYSKWDLVCGKIVFTLLFKSSEDVVDFAKKTVDTFSREIITYPRDLAEAAMPTYHGGAGKKNIYINDFYQKSFVKNYSIKWGINEPDNDTIKQIERSIGHEFETVLINCDINTAYDPAAVRAKLDSAWAMGKLCVLTLRPFKHPSGINDIYGMLGSDFDNYFKACAKSISEFGHPVVLRLFNEANCDWQDYSAYKFCIDTSIIRKLHIHIAKFFKAAGAVNALWVFNPYFDSFPNYKWNDVRLYYPGDEYADIWGLTACNTGSYYAGESWKTFDELYKELYRKTMSRTDMPLMICELACAREGGSKEEWVLDLHKRIKDYPAIKMAVWKNTPDFDGEKESRAYGIADSDELKAIWKDYFEKLK